MIPNATPFHLAHTRRDTVGMCDALLDVLVPSRAEAIVGRAADSGPIDAHVRQQTERDDERTVLR